MADFCMPSLGADMDAGTLVEWRIAPGDRVDRGQVVALVETDKGLVEVEMWEPGVVDALVVPAGSKVPVGTVLAKTHAPGAAAPAAAAPMPAAAPDAARVMASPAAKQLARERGIDLAAVHGTGPHGAITRMDVEHATSTSTSAGAEAPAGSGAGAPSIATPTPTSTSTTPSVDTAGMRRAIAAAMARSKREIPHYYLATDIEVSAASAWLEAENARRAVPDRLLFATLLLKATALAAREVPEMNGFYVDGEFRPSTGVHVGVAVSLRQGGLVAPAIHDVQTMPLGELQAKLRDLVGRARAGRLRSSEMTDPTLTVTNLGDQGVASVFGVIYPPQVALVGFGKVLERPWAAGGMLGVRPVVTATLAADHRASDGHRGATFLSAIARLLSEPEKL